MTKWRGGGLLFIGSQAFQRKRKRVVCAAQTETLVSEQGFSCIENIWARAYAIFPSAYDKSRAPKAKKVSDGKKKKKNVFITCMHGRIKKPRAPGPGRVKGPPPHTRKKEKKKKCI